MSETRALVSPDQLAGEYVRRAKAPNTLRAYRADLRAFAAFCRERGEGTLPADGATVARYLATLAAGGYKMSTIQRRLVAINLAHKTRGHPPPGSDPTVRAIMQGIARVHGTAAARKAPLVTARLQQVLGGLGDDLHGRRDRALLLLGFAAALRRSELVALDVGDLAAVPEGLVLTLRRSKTDQEGAGRIIGVPYGRDPALCPVRALAAWREAGSITEGALFRPLGRAGVVGDERLSDRAVARVVQRAARAAGLDPAHFGGHSLRAGLATSAAAADVSERVIAQQTGHKSMTVLRTYIRTGQLFRENAAGAVL